MNIKDIRKLAVDILNNIPDGEEINISDVREVVRRRVFSEDADEDDFKSVYNIVYSCISPVIITEGLKRVEVTNFPTQKEYPSELKVNNLSELVDKIEELKKSINAIEVSPKVTVNPPDIKVDVPAVSIPDINIDLDGIIESLRKIRENAVDNPLSVRLSNGDEWVKELKEQRAQTTQYMSDVSYIKDSNGNRINPATSDSPSALLNDAVTVTTAGTEIQISSTSTAIKSITVKALAANTGTIYVGNSTVASTNGYPLSAGQAISFDIDNLNKVYIDSSVNGEGVRYLAVN